MDRFWEWFALICGIVIAAIVLVPWPLILSSWWGLAAFLAWPLFIWVISR